MKAAVFFCSVILAMGTAISSHAQSFLTNGLVAYYPFNGNANDTTGNGNNGFVIGAVLRTDRFGNTNAAYSFNGVNKYIAFSGPPLAQIDNWSMSAWIKPASLNQNGMAVCLGYDDANDGNGFEFGIGNNFSTGNHFSGFLGGVTFADSGSTIANTNIWYQMVMLCRNGTTMFYLNGTPTPNTYSQPPRTPSAFTIGSGTGVRFFNGAIDDVRIYNRALSDDEVSQLYQIEKLPFGSPHLNLKKVVYVTVDSVTPDYLYQLQVSSDLVTWTNVGSQISSPTNSITFTNYWNVDDWNQLYFRLQ